MTSKKNKKDLSKLRGKIIVTLKLCNSCRKKSFLKKKIVMKNIESKNHKAVLKRS